MIEDGVNYFKKVPNSEKKELFKLLVSSKVILLIKPESQDEVLNYQAINFYEGDLLLKASNDELKLNKPQSCFISFSIDDDRYYCTADVGPLGKNNEGAVLKLSADLYVLQRRKTLRIQIPKNYPGFFNVLEKNTSKVFIEGQLIDFSSGGVKVRVIQNKANVELKSGDLVKGSLHLNHRRPIELEAKIKHIKKENNSVVFGAQFTNLTKILENRMMILNMDLHREIFIKFSNKSE